MKNKHTHLVIGQIALVLGLLGYVINHWFLDNQSYLAFFSGLMFGLSLTLNISYLMKIRKKENRN